MDRKLEFCHGCFDKSKEFKEWCGEEFLSKETLPSKRREFWEYASRELRRECAVLGWEDYPTFLCYDCCKDIVEDWAKYLGIPKGKVFG